MNIRHNFARRFVAAAALALASSASVPAILAAQCTITTICITERTKFLGIVLWKETTCSSVEQCTPA